MKLSRFTVFALVVSASIFALSSCGKSSSVTSADPNLDSAPPAAPTTLSSTWVEAMGNDYLYWNRSSSANVAGYEIWESTTQGGTSHFLASAPASANSAILPNVSADCTRYYQVRARATNGAFSALSAPVAVVRHADAPNQASGGNGGNTDGGLRISE